MIEPDFFFLKIPFLTVGMRSNLLLSPSYIIEFQHAPKIMITSFYSKYDN